MRQATIYVITNMQNGRQYVGATILALSVRWSNHKSMLRNKLHTNGILQFDWDYYGSDAFTCEILEIVDSKESNAIEKEWTIKLHAYYNLEKLDKNVRRPLHSAFNREDTHKLKQIAKSLGFTHLGEGSIYNFLRAVIDGDVRLRIDKEDPV